MKKEMTFPHSNGGYKIFICWETFYKLQLFLESS